MKKILIIEDGPDILEVLQHVFTTDTFDPIVSSRPLSVEMIINLAPDVILLDHWLGDRSGGDLCKEIKSSPFANKVPVILLSAHLRLSDVANDCNADGFFCKPFEINRLYKYIEGFMINN